jgi:hypothetical protein
MASTGSSLKSADGWRPGHFNYFGLRGQQAIAAIKEMATAGRLSSTRHPVSETSLPMLAIDA